MKRRVGLLMVSLMLSMMMCTGTVCYGAEAPENDAGADEPDKGARSVNTQTGSKDDVCKLVCDGYDVYVTIALSYSWDEGYTGWFTAWMVSKYYCEDAVVSSPSVKVDMDGGTITFKFNLTVNGVGYTGSKTYTVNEYGEVL